MNHLDIDDEGDRHFGRADFLVLLVGALLCFFLASVLMTGWPQGRGTAFFGALLFAFLPYHFARILMGHVFYTWYFVTPIYFYTGFRIFVESQQGIRFRSWLRVGAVLLISSCFGVYFAFFGVMVILICGIAGFLQHKNYRAISSHWQQPRPAVQRYTWR